jgi:hypothetical protein
MLETHLWVADLVVAVALEVEHNGGIVETGPYSVSQLYLQGLISMQRHDEAPRECREKLRVVTYLLQLLQTFCFSNCTKVLRHIALKPFASEAPASGAVRSNHIGVELLRS